MPNERFPEIRINLVEEKEWKEHWDFAEKKNFWESDQAWEDFRHMDAQSLEGYIDDLWESKDARGRRPRRKLTSEELEWLAKNVQKEPLSEAVQQPITDALTWMYEAAAMPTHRDIRDSMERAFDETFGDFRIDQPLWSPILAISLRRGPKEWRPRSVHLLTEEQILKDLLTYIRFEREENAYDRYLVFDFGQAKVVSLLGSHSRNTEEDVTHALRVEFDAIQQEYMGNFWKALQREMDNIDIYNRADFRPSWKSMLSDPSIGKHARAAILEALKKMPEEEEDV